ncbi:uracil-DNA glycosylase [Alsobacter soli]|uniref:Type-4 uracil-DNA glycosylase n=1 Tax=Alsobacter soli TaxID=2109933 RepID=A0A2T1HST4_9HYPH|nr:uracil-DNA glycosylase [Alsobacter soli]PSC04678.1 uracil-DNA glycosylase [Alsobacter soli]
MEFPDIDRGVAAADLLAWYAAMGVDALVDDDPHDRFAEAPQTPRRDAAPSPTPEVARPVGFAGASSAADDVAAEARMLARSAQSLDELRGLLEKFEGCALKLTARSLVFADGNPEGRVMFVGEAPGAEEDRTGLPFVGRSGQLLDRMLAAIGMDRTQVYVANIIPWRPPGNRTPTPQEFAVCQPFIARQIELSKAEVLVCLGGPSAQGLLGVKDGIQRTRGRWMEYNAGSRRVKAIATLHPAYLLRQPLQKRLAWRDFKMIRAALDG